MTFGVRKTIRWHQQLKKILFNHAAYLHDDYIHVDPGKYPTSSMKWLRPAFLLLLLIALVIGLNTKWGNIPPLGKVLNPFRGVWQNAETRKTPRDRNISLRGNDGAITIYFNERGVPHIFAGSDRDLYFAQGYITARDRLWQMEFQTHAAAGRLSEIIGRPALGYDRTQRRLGMVYGAERRLAPIMADSLTREVLEAYTDGINEWIRKLRPSNRPIEYKLLDYRPEPWTPMKSALLQMSMSYTLSGFSSDFHMSNTHALLGDDFVKAFFPPHPGNADPIIPPGHEWNFEPLTVEAPSEIYIPDQLHESLVREPDHDIGSNSWAVHGDRTRSGRPILANDMHLELSLPSIWYEIQLNAPGVNVYGVSLPGVPNVIVGFNEHLGWGFTNVGADVMDIYDIRFRDDSMTEYYHDGQWKPVDFRIEYIQLRRGFTVTDTVRYTHHGPVVNNNRGEITNNFIPGGHALRWSAHDFSNELLMFYQLNRASDYDTYTEVIDEFKNPAQNFTYADKAGNISIRSNGKFPVRWHGQGHFISDGTDPLYDWHEFIPHHHKPFIKNPDRGFVSSANQHPAGPDYPYELGRFFASYERGARINEFLTESTDVTPEILKRLQLDNKSLHAESVLPVLLSHIDESTLNGNTFYAYSKLVHWNYHNNAEEVAPSIFNRFWSHLYISVWEPLYGKNMRYMRLPSRDRTVQLILQEPDSPYLNGNASGDGLSLTDRITMAFSRAVEDLEARYHDPGPDWLWGNHQGARIKHLANLPGFSRDLFTGGGSESVNATTGSHGPSWRMIVSMEDEQQAWGIYPGGQSGNPGSARYDEFTDEWALGRYFPLRLYPGEEEARSEASYTIQIR
jgi:penicillin G amidase